MQSNPIMDANTRARQLVNEIMNHLIDCDHNDSLVNSKVIEVVKSSSLILIANSPLISTISEFTNDWCELYETAIIPKLKQLIDPEVSDDVSQLLEMIQLLTDSIVIVRDGAAKMIITGIYLSDITIKYRKIRLELSNIDRSLNTHMIIAKKTLKSAAIKMQLRRLELVIDKVESRMDSLEKVIES